ncbi:ABC-type uncharacterized transport system substrate-binding protein [Geothermobacter ehrlichii]|uniref:ABC-type uncharacterized transport system substrate-binding protein n=1 Tax=Geothermobacter ehrlichii TaxID=213224 RepID=A0A5D3WMM4_9BACT|nr:ABC transporter substrate binding protein [Geothermobacter ehrlichii]TYO99847.1 ABC-type uncharacterized transport system substrate-binding protein [Geothermobacter ehrlichii]
MKRRFGILLSCLLLLVLAAPVRADHEQKRLFLVASYDPDNVCGMPQEEGALEELRNQGWIEGKTLLVERFYMDTKRRYVSPEAMRQRGQQALKRLRAFAPDVVLTLDDNAFREVGLALAGQKIPVVFSGLNGQPEDYNRRHHFMNSREHPGGNITGVYEKLYVKKAIELLATAFPDRRGQRVVGIVDDSPTGKGINRQFEIEMAGHNSVAGLYWESRQVSSFEEYRQLIRQLNADPTVGAIYPVAARLPTADGRILTAQEIIAWTVEHNGKPELAVNYFFSKLGLFGGAAVDFHKMGAMAGRQIAWILDGRKAGDLSIVDAPDFALVFNLTRAQQLHLELPMTLLTAADHVYRQRRKHQTE